MRCPFCEIDNDRVIDSRTSQEGASIRRRRECAHCKRRYTTYEQPGDIEIKVIKKDGVRQPFATEKIRQGLARACWKRPISDEQIEAVVTAVQRDVYDNFDTEVESSQLGEMLMEHLRQLDQVAFVRFASVYRRFEDIHDFVNELQPMLKEPRQSRK
jgi:transcriptional repressor NrdR